MEAQVKESIKLDWDLYLSDLYEKFASDHISKEAKELIRNKVINFKVVINSDFQAEVEVWIEKEDEFNEFMRKSPYTKVNNDKKFVLTCVAVEVLFACFMGKMDSVLRRWQ